MIYFTIAIVDFNQSINVKSIKHTIPLVYFVPKACMQEELQGQITERLAEQQKELQNVFATEKQDLLQQSESRRNLEVLQLETQIKDLEEKYVLCRLVIC